MLCSDIDKIQKYYQIFNKVITTTEANAQICPYVNTLKTQFASLFVFRTAPSPMLVAFTFHFIDRHEGELKYRCEGIHAPCDRLVCMHWPIDTFILQ